MDRNLARGLFLMAIALFFGLQALSLPIGQFSRAGAGLFPLMVSSLLFIVGVATVIGARYAQHVPLDFNFRNIAIILVSLCGLAVISHFVNMIAGIVFMVFASAFAGTSYSVLRNLKVAAGLVAVAFAFHKLLGLNLPLY